MRIKRVKNVRRVDQSNRRKVSKKLVLLKLLYLLNIKELTTHTIRKIIIKFLYFTNGVCVVSGRNKNTAKMLKTIINKSTIIIHLFGL